MAEPLAVPATAGPLLLEAIAQPTLRLVLPMSVGLVIVHFLPLHRAASLLEGNEETWQSVANGISIAYVFLDIHPEIHDVAEVAMANRSGLLGTIGTHIYGVTLLGFLCFHFLEVRARGRADHRTRGQPVFWLRSAVLSLTNFLIGVMLSFLQVFFHPANYLLFFVAFAIHLFVVDYRLYEATPTLFTRYGRGLAAGSLVTGLGVGLLLHSLRLLAIVDTALLFAFLGGGLIYHAFVNETESPAESDVTVFLLSAVGYGVLLVLV